MQHSPWGLTGSGNIVANEGSGGFKANYVVAVMINQELLFMQKFRPEFTIANTVKKSNTIHQQNHNHICKVPLFNTWYHTGL